MLPLLSDFESQWLDTLNQDPDREGTWSRAQINRVANQAYKTVWRACSEECEGIFVREVDITVPAGETETDLPADFLTHKELKRLDTSGRECGDVRAVPYSEAGAWSGREAFILNPLERKSRWAGRCDTSAQTYRLFYEAKPLWLPHGCLQGGGASEFQLAAHEPNSADIVGQTIHFVAGTGCGQTPVAASYDGCTKAVEPVDLITSADTTTYYSSQPNLPFQAEDLFYYEGLVRLAQQLQDERLPQFMSERRDKREDLPNALFLLSRSDHLQMRDDSGTGVFGDALEFSHYGRS